MQLGGPDHLLGESSRPWRSPRCAAISATEQRRRRFPPGRVFGAASSRDSAAYASAGSSRPRRSSATERDQRHTPRSARPGLASAHRMVLEQPAARSSSPDQSRTWATVSPSRHEAPRRTAPRTLQLAPPARGFPLSPRSGARARGRKARRRADGRHRPPRRARRRRDCSSPASRPSRKRTLGRASGAVWRRAPQRARLRERLALELDGAAAIYRRPSTLASESSASAPFRPSAGQREQPFGEPACPLRSPPVAAWADVAAAMRQASASASPGRCQAGSRARRALPRRSAPPSAAAGSCTLLESSFAGSASAQSGRERRDERRASASSGQLRQAGRAHAAARPRTVLVEDQRAAARMRRGESPRSVNSIHVLRSSAGFEGASADVDEGELRDSQSFVCRRQHRGPARLACGAVETGRTQLLQALGDEAAAVVGGAATVCTTSGARASSRGVETG